MHARVRFPHLRGLVLRVACAQCVAQLRQHARLRRQRARRERVLAPQRRVGRRGGLRRRRHGGALVVMARAFRVRGARRARRRSSQRGSQQAAGASAALHARVLDTSAGGARDESTTPFLPV
jgi:hypothetical protein